MKKKKSTGFKSYKIWHIVVIALAGFFLAWYGRVLIHEMGHAIMATLMGASSVEIQFNIAWGMTTIWIAESVANWQLVLIYIAGCTSTLIVGLIFLWIPAKHPWGTFFNILALIFVAASCSDMIPTMINSDGYQLAAIWGNELQWGIFLVFCLFAFYVLLKVVTPKDNKLKLKV